jgi:hypothetical protein
MPAHENSAGGLGAEGPGGNPTPPGGSVACSGGPTRDCFAGGWRGQVRRSCGGHGFSRSSAYETEWCLGAGPPHPPPLNTARTERDRVGGSARWRPRDSKSPPPSPTPPSEPSEETVPCPAPGATAPLQRGRGRTRPPEKHKKKSPTPKSKIKSFCAPTEKSCRAKKNQTEARTQSGGGGGVGGPCFFRGGGAAGVGDGGW